MAPRMAKHGGEAWARCSAIPARRSNNSMSRSLQPQAEQFLAGIPPSLPRMSMSLGEGGKAYRLTIRVSTYNRDYRPPNPVSPGEIQCVAIV
ncbi:hypothetical protein CFAM422_004563 [Trichoderma lentiforme]|uniref:Uncharacterized protein n=1 Tax=Trichoderma lentiforme TaxID=1567552 RepID=A0A9P5CGC6_9HYPO|nr:hypothetical protein CFAM422_004563 [Trichoderma lentiforme]